MQLNVPVFLVTFCHFTEPMISHILFSHKTALTNSRGKHFLLIPHTLKKWKKVKFYLVKGYSEHGLLLFIVIFNDVMLFKKVKVNPS